MFSHAISLLFEDDTERALQRQRAKLRRAGFVVPSGRHHITLAYVASLDPLGLEGCDLRFPQTVAVAGCGLVPNTGNVVGLRPALPELRDMHGRLHALLTRLHVPSFEYCQPGNWVPHVSIAHDVAPERTASAVRLLSSACPARLNISGLVLYDIAHDRVDDVTTKAWTR